MIEESVKNLAGGELHCRNWQIEGAFRMLHNVIDPEVAKDPKNLIVYGSSGRAARGWENFHAIAHALRELGEDETLLVQSGKPVAIFKTHTMAPRVLIANALIVPKWATLEYFLELEQKGLTMFGQMTAGSWAYIGTQGILQGTYETLAKVAEEHFQSTLKDRIVVSAGLGEMGGAQPLAVTMNDGIALIIEVRKSAIERQLQHKYLQAQTENLEDALAMINDTKEKGETLSVGLLGNAAEILPELARRGFVPDILTDQTSAHDPLKGYYPAGLSIEEADELRASNPTEYITRAKKSMATHVEAMVDLQKKGAITFEYGNNLRQQALDAGYKEAFSFPGFVQAYIRPLFCEGRGPFRWTSLVGSEEDIYKLDDVILNEFSANKGLARWIKKAHEEVKFQGLPARVCWLGLGERDKFGLIINEMVRKGELSGPVWIGRDHLDAGSVASPRRETEGMLDGSDAIADWPILNALLNTAAGATWVSVHHGGGVGIGYSIHAGMCLVADGTAEAKLRISRVLVTDPGLGVIRHADAGYEQAIRVAREKGLKMPTSPKPEHAD